MNHDECAGGRCTKLGGRLSSGLFGVDCEKVSLANVWLVLDIRARKLNIDSIDTYGMQVSSLMLRSTLAVRQA